MTRGLIDRRPALAAFWDEARPFGSSAASAPVFSLRFVDLPELPLPE
jgi:hypothetical protein